ncbi:MAG TPA: lysophospholipid acyltransferase family protein, partial [Nitriliruptoraceae bacterium]|nr:lysophospholipid acyltransferase family protein [Nitriliruptoraceae bacterium]
MTTDTAHPTPSDPTDHAGPTPINWTWRLLRAVVQALFLGLFRWRHTVTGIQHVPATGPAIVTWNHHSYSDFLMMSLAIVDGRRRVVRLLGKSEIWDNKVLAAIADSASAVPVYRGARGGGGALDAAREALERGDVVALAPEQTISQSFELLPFASGAARLARDSGAPVIPSAGWGSHRMSTKGHSFQPAFGIPVVT